MDRKRLRILCPVHIAGSGGVERVALRLCRQWAAQGVDVTVLAGRGHQDLGERAAGCRAAPISSRRLPNQPLEALWMLAALLRLLSRDPPDAIFCPGNTYAFLAGAVRLLTPGGRPPLILKISNSLDRSDMRWPIRLAYHAWLRIQGRFIDRFVVMAPPLASEAARRLAVAADRIAVVLNGPLDAETIRRLGEVRRPDPLQRRRYLAAGRLVAQKRFDLLIRAFALGRREGDELLILGDGPLRYALERTTLELGCAQSVSFLGHRNDPVEQFRSCHVLVMASDYEGLPSVMIEALASGMNVITTESSSTIPWLLEHGRLGTIVPRGSVAELARAIREASPASPSPERARAVAGQFMAERSASAYLEMMVPMLCESHQH